MKKNSWISTIFLIVLLFQLGCFHHIWAQETAPISPIACLNLLQKSTLSDHDYAQIDTTLMQANAFTDTLVLVAYKKGIEQALSNKQLKWAALFERRLAHLYHENRQVKNALQHGEAAEKYFKTIPDEIGLAHLYGDLRVIYAERFEYEKAFKICYQALKIFEKKEDLIGQVTILEDLGSLFIHQKKYEAAIDYFEMALALLNQIDEGKLRGLIYVKLASTYQELNRPEEALKYINLSIPYADYFNGYARLDHLANRYFMRASIHKTLGNWQLVQADGLKAKKYADTLGNRAMIPWINNVLGESYLGQTDYKAALDYFQMVQRELKENKESIQYAYNLPLYKNMAQAYAGLENFQNAFIFSNQHNLWLDSVYQYENSRQVDELRTQYETEKKEVAIAQLQQEKRARLRLLWASGILLFVTTFLGLFLYRDNRFRQQTNQQIQDQNRAILQKNQQNELLLKEIHHRVKNNLELVSSLLELQSEKVQDPDVQVIMKASQGRVESMGIIHQKLYQGENLGSIEMLDYFKNLCENLLDTFGRSDQIDIFYDMMPLELHIDTAVPIGLIVNELITNSLKHAFPKNQSGEIQISLRTCPEQNLHLEIRDNGIGKTNIPSNKKEGFGMQLVDLLTLQLDGSKEENIQNGTHFTFLFKNLRDSS